MSIDFYYAFLTGWSFLCFFWFLTLLFIFLRKPPKSKLTVKITLFSLLIFVLGYLTIIFFK